MPEHMVLSLLTLAKEIGILVQTEKNDGLLQKWPMPPVHTGAIQSDEFWV